MDHATALRIFGSPDGSDDLELRRAYWVLRSHVEERLRKSGPAETDSEHSARIAELERLDRALEAIVGPGDRLAEFLQPPAETAPTFLVSRTWLAVGFLGLVLATGSVMQDRIAEFLSSALSSTSSPPEVETEAPVARLTLSVEPSGGSIQIEDLADAKVVYHGLGDEVSRPLSSGRYRLTVEHPKCDTPWSREIELEAGERREIVAKICRNVGWLVVRSNLTDDELTIDGEVVGQTGLDEYSLPPGRHEIRVAKSGFSTWEASLTLPAAERITLQANLAPHNGRTEGANPATAATRLAVNPSPAAVSAPAAGTGPRASTGESAQSNRDGEQTFTRSELNMAASWHRSAKQYLLGRYDRDRSGLLDTPEEVDAVPCSDWLGLEDSFDASGLALSMTTFFGFDGTKWVEDAFGVSRDMRTATYLHLKKCGVR
jgi:hypothetical protein